MTARVLTSGHPPETRTRVLTYDHSPGPLKHDIVLGLKVCRQGLRSKLRERIGLLYILQMLRQADRAFSRENTLHEAV